MRHINPFQHPGTIIQNIFERGLLNECISLSPLSICLVFYRVKRDWSAYQLSLVNRSGFCLEFGSRGIFIIICALCLEIFCHLHSSLKIRFRTIYTHNNHSIWFSRPDFRLWIISTGFSLFFSILHPFQTISC